MIFRTIPLRFEFEANEALRIPPGKTANTLRGALGMVLPPAVFSPQAEGAGPSGFEDRPRPFVLRPGDPNGHRLAVTVNVFADDAVLALEDAFARIAQLGPARQSVRLIDARRLPEVRIDLAAIAPLDSLRVRFLTPTELKFEGATLREPRFDALFSRARDRVATLRALYQGGAPDADYRALGERARNVTMTASQIEQTDTARRSSRTGQTHPLGGFTGEAEYTGDLGEFLPWLKAAERTGVGRYTVWGNGVLAVEPGPLKG
jgi:hypothetical protein